MRRIFFALAFVLIAAQACASSVSGEVAIAGLDNFNSTGITFINPAVVLTGTGDLGLLDNFPQIDLASFNFAAAHDTVLWDWNHSGIDVSFEILALDSVQLLPHFLNVKGTAAVSFTGRTTTEFDFALTSTHADDVSSYTMNITPAAIVPEPAPLFLLGAGLLSMAGVLLRQKRASQCA